MKNKTLVIILAIIIFAILATVQFGGYFDFNKLVDFLTVPFLVFGVLLLIILNLPKVQLSMKGIMKNDDPRKKYLFTSENETTLAGPVCVTGAVRFTGMIPVLYIFPKILATSERIQFGLLPFLTSPSLSFFFTKQSKTESLISQPTEIIRYSRGGGSILLVTSQGETWKIFMGRKKLDEIDMILKDRIKGI